MGAAVLVFVVFVWYERDKKTRDGSPLVELSLFKVKSFAAGIGVQLTYGVISGIFFLIWTLYMQLGLGWSPLHAGLTGVPFSVAASVSAGVSVQMLVPRFGRKVLQAGALVKLVGVLLYIWAADQHGSAITSWQMLPPLVVMGLGMGLIIAPITDAVLSEVPTEHAGSASGLINTINQLGLALGLGLVAVVFFSVVDSGREAQPARRRRLLRRLHPRPVVGGRWPGAGLRVDVRAAQVGEPGRDGSRPPEWRSSPSERPDPRPPTDLVGGLRRVRREAQGSGRATPQIFEQLSTVLGDVVAPAFRPPCRTLYQPNDARQ